MASRESMLRRELQAGGSPRESGNVSGRKQRRDEPWGSNMESERDLPEPGKGRLLERGSIDHFPQRYARLGGALYLAIIVLGAFAEGFVSNKLIVSGDAAATAANILASPELWRLSVAGNFMVVLCAVPLLWIEYLLLRPVSRQLVCLPCCLIWCPSLSRP